MSHSLSQRIPLSYKSYSFFKKKKPSFRLKGYKKNQKLGMAKTIMVVEDDADIREIIGLLLEMEKYEVALCENIQCFRDKIFHIKPDLVILDVMLPDGNGIDLCAEIKEDTVTGHIPILMMSANSNLCTIRERCQVDDFIPKPFDIDEFIGRVFRLINNLD